MRRQPWLEAIPKRSRVDIPVSASAVGFGDTQPHIISNIVTASLRVRHRQCSLCSSSVFHLESRTVLQLCVVKQTHRLNEDTEANTSVRRLAIIRFLPTRTVWGIRSLVKPGPSRLRNLCEVIRRSKRRVIRNLSSCASTDCPITGNQWSADDHNAYLEALVACLKRPRFYTMQDHGLVSGETHLICMLNSWGFIQHRHPREWIWCSKWSLLLNCADMSVPSCLCLISLSMAANFHHCGCKTGAQSMTHQKFAQAAFQTTQGL